MADSFGLKIGLEGEKEFKKALADINQSFKVLSSEMKLATSQFDKNDKSVEALAARNKVLRKEIDEQTTKIDTLRKALQNAATSFGENDRRTQNWQIQLNNAEAALNDMNRELDENEKAIKEGGKAAVEAAKAAGWTDIKCIEIAGVQGDATNTARMEGYREGVNEAGGEFLDAETQYANATADLAVTAMEGIMSKYPEGVAIICSNNDDMALAAARTAKDNPNYAKTIFLGFDGQKSAVEAVLNGELTMTAAQNNFDIGYKAVETIVKILNGEEYGDVDTGTEIITKDNAQARLDNFANWLK